MAEVTITEPPSVPPAGATPQRAVALGADAGMDGDLNVLLTGNRIQITADVDLAGLARLKEVLGHYENILKLLSPSAPSH